MTKEEILAAMKEKYDIKDDDQKIKPSELKKPACAIDDEDCLECGS